jgi:glycosyltransferase involved in cell wall biosynthesis
MKRILIISTFIPPFAGGAEQVAWQLAKRLVNDFDVHLLTTTRRGAESGNEGIMFHYVPYIRPLSFFYNTLFFPYLFYLQKKWCFDIYNMHNVLPWGEVFRKLSGKSVVSCHGSDILIDQTKHRSKTVKKVLDEAAAVVSASGFLAEHIERKFNIDVKVIPNGVDMGRFNTKGVSPKSQRTILFFGRFHNIKGIKYLLEAAALLPDYKFEFIGSGPLSGSIKGSNVHNLGFIEDLTEYIRRAALCIFPSLSESFPLAGLEAMACGTAVIATKRGYSEYIEHGKDGWLINPGSVDEIVAAIKKLMSDSSLRRSIEENAVKKALLYSWDRMAERYAGLFNALCDGDR